MFTYKKKLNWPFTCEIIIIFLFFLKNGQSHNHYCIHTYATNCHTNIEQSPKFTRYNYISFLGSVHIHDDCSLKKKALEDVKVNWEVWRWHENKAQETKVKDITARSNCVIEEDSLDYGIYRLKMLSHVFFQDSTKKNVEEECYFEVVDIGTQTIIYGGLFRTIEYDYDLNLDVSTMLAPHRHTLSKNMKLSYWWACNYETIQALFCHNEQTSSTHWVVPEEGGGFYKTLKDYYFLAPYKFIFELSIEINRINIKYPKVEKGPVQTVILSDFPGANIGISCLLNCGGYNFKSNHQDIIHFEAIFDKVIFKTVPEKEATFVWLYQTKEGDETEVPSEARSNDFLTKDSELRIKRDFLNENREYLFTVKFFAYGVSRQEAQIQIFTSTKPSNINCSIVSENDAKMTIKDISCTHEYLESEVTSLYFEFFNKHDAMENGRHLGFSKSGELQDLLLTRPQIYVRLTNLFGVSDIYLTNIVDDLNTRFDLDVQNHLDLEIGTAYGFQNHFLHNYFYRITLATAYCDLLSNSNVTSQFKFDKINFMLNKLHLERKPDFEEAITLNDALTHIVRIINNTEPKSLLKSESILFIANIMKVVSSCVKDIITDPRKTNSLITTQRIHNIAKELLQISNLVLVLKRNYNLLHLDTRNDLKRGISDMTKALKNILISLEFQQSFAIEELEIKSENIRLSSFRWKKEDEQLKKFLTSTQGKILNLIPVPKLHINMITFEINPFWWSNGYKINTYVKMVFLPLFPTKFISESKVKQMFHDKYIPIRIKIKEFNYLSISGKAKQPNPHDSPEINDIKITVHRIESEPNSLSFINFTYIENDTSLRVLILEGQRPDFDYMEDYSTIITTKSSTLDFSMEEVKGEFFYIGILPVRNVSVGEEVDYNFTIFTAACRIWKYETWTGTEQCYINEDTSSKSELQCVCQVRSAIVAGYIHVPSHRFNPFSDFPLFMTVKEYPLVIVILIIVWILYFLLLFWARKKDKEDKQKLAVIVLEDNDPRDSFAYLVGVFTGARLGGGTTSNIGIRLFGDMGFSRSHILNSLHCPTLKSNSDNWFLLFSPRHLGALTNVLLWSDYSGERPNWYCSKILIYDMARHENEFFFIESWFGMTEEGLHLETYQECATYKETNMISRIISENLHYCFMETHYWLSVFCKHPRSPVTRVLRLSAVICGLFVNSLVCILLFYPSNPQSVDFSSFDITKDTLIIATIGSLSGSSVTILIMYGLYSCYKETESPQNIETNKDFCDIYHLKRKITKFNVDPEWLIHLKRFISQHLRLAKAFPLQTSPHFLFGMNINKKRLKFFILLCVVIMLICCPFIIALSLRYDHKKIKLTSWSIIFSIFLTIIMIMPIKICAVALLLGCTKTRYYELVSFSIALNNILYDLKQKYSKSYKRFLARLRNLEMYKSPSEYKTIKLAHKNQRYVLALHIYYIIGCISFICVVVWIILLFNIGLYFLMNVQTFCTEFGPRSDCQTVYRYDLNNVLEFWVSLSTDILPTLYTQRWYNGQNKSLPQEIFHETGWLLNGASRLIGVPRLRQIRIKPYYDVSQCHVPEIMKKIVSTCHIPTTRLSMETEDNKDYGVGWENRSWFRELFDTSPWSYRQPTTTAAYMRGPSGRLYHDGGYTAFLGRNLDGTKAMLSHLLDTNWIDTHSRVLILDFTMYAANHDVFTETSIVTELLTVGSVKVLFYFKSIVFSSLLSAVMLYGVMMIIFGLQLLCQMNIVGTQKFLGSLWNVYDCVILVWFVYSVLSLCGWYLIASSASEQLSKQGKDVYFSIDDIIGFKNNIKDVVGAIFSLVLIRLLRIIKFNEDIRLYAHDLLNARTEIFFACIITTMLMFVQVRFIMFLTVPPFAHRPKDVLIFRSQFKKIVRHTYRHSSTGKVLAYLLNFTSQLGIFSFMLSQYHHFKKAQKTRVQNLRLKRAKDLIGQLEK